MEKEIFEQPSVIPQTISTFIKNNLEIKIDLMKLGFKNKKHYLYLQLDKLLCCNGW